MAFTAVGSPTFVSNSTTFSLTPGGVGDLILVQVTNNDSSTIVASSLSSSNVTWQQWGSSISNSGGGVTSVQFAGTVTSTGTATVTVAWSGATPSDIRIAYTEFSTTTGHWVLGAQDNLGGGGSTPEGNTWASLTPAGTLGLLYWGFCLDAVDAVAGSTPGYTYAVDGVHGNGIAFNPSCVSGVATAPVWGDSTQVFGIMGVVMETTISVVQSNSSAETSNVSLSSNVTTGNSVILIAASYNTAGTDSSSSPTYNGNPVKGAVKLIDGLGTLNVYQAYGAIWLLPNLIGGSTGPFAVTFVNGAPFAYQAIEVAGLGTVPKAGPASEGSGSSSTADSGSTSAIGGSAFITGLGVANLGAYSSTPASFPWAAFSLGDNYGASGYQIAFTGSFDWQPAMTETAQWASMVAGVYPAVSVQPLEQLPPIFQQRILYGA